MESRNKFSRNVKQTTPSSNLKKILKEIKIMLKNCDVINSVKLLDDLGGYKAFRLFGLFVVGRQIVVGGMHERPPKSRAVYFYLVTKRNPKTVFYFEFRHETLKTTKFRPALTKSVTVSNYSSDTIFGNVFLHYQR